MWISLLVCVERSALSQRGKDLSLSSAKFPFWCSLSLKFLTLQYFPPQITGALASLTLGLYVLSSAGPWVCLGSLSCSLAWKVLLGRKQGQFSGTPYLCSHFQDHSPVFSIVQCLNIVVS